MIYFGRANEDMKEEIEDLINGKTIECIINENIVYSDITSSKEHIYNFLLMCGYLTVDTSKIIVGRRIAQLKIPNLEVKQAFSIIIQEWFRKNQSADNLGMFQKSLIENDVFKANKSLNEILLNSISYFDTKENFYHGLLLGMLASLDYEYIVTSNREAGYGRYDIAIEKRDGSIAIVIEVKICNKDIDRENPNEDLEKLANEALNQIETNIHYADFINKKIPKIYTYGIAFDSKRAVIK